MPLGVNLMRSQVKHQTGIMQANQKVQDAWAHVKSKEPLNRRNSQMPSSNSNASGQLHQPQPQQPQPQVQSESQPQFSRQGSHSRQDTRDSRLAQQNSRESSHSRNEMRRNSQAGSLGQTNGAGQVPSPSNSMQAGQMTAFTHDPRSLQQGTLPI